MHKSSLNRMEWFRDEYLFHHTTGKLKVLDVGAQDFNGSYKHLFPADQFEYFGLDMEKGKNVDIVEPNPYKWSLDTNSFDVVISGQAFEHTEFFWLTMMEMTRVLKPHGTMCIIAPNGFEEHRYPVDCYRFFTDGMVALARYCNLNIMHASTNMAPSPNSKGWFSSTQADSILVAKKPYSGRTQTINPESYSCLPARHQFVHYPLTNRKPTPKLLRIVLKKIIKIIG